MLDQFTEDSTIILDCCGIYDVENAIYRDDEEMAKGLAFGCRWWAAGGWERVAF